MPNYAINLSSLRIHEVSEVTFHKLNFISTLEVPSISHQILAVIWNGYPSLLWWQFFYELSFFYVMLERQFDRYSKVYVNERAYKLEFS